MSGDRWCGDDKSRPECGDGKGTTNSFVTPSNEMDLHDDKREENSIFCPRLSANETNY